MLHRNGQAPIQLTQTRAGAGKPPHPLNFATLKNPLTSGSVMVHSSVNHACAATPNTNGPKTHTLGFCARVSRSQKRQCRWRIDRDSLMAFELGAPRLYVADDLSIPLCMGGVPFRQDFCHRIFFGACMQPTFPVNPCMQACVCARSQTVVASGALIGWPYLCRA
jgi:hypothetical protein